MLVIVFCDSFIYNIAGSADLSNITYFISVYWDKLLMKELPTAVRFHTYSRIISEKMKVHVQLFKCRFIGKLKDENSEKLFLNYCSDINSRSNHMAFCKTKNLKLPFKS